MDHSFNAPLPEELVTHVSEILGKEGAKWLRNLPALIGHLEELWSVKIGIPFAAGEFNYVAPARRNESEDVVVKIAPPYPDGEVYSEAAWLKHHNGVGCIRLIEQDRDARAYLMERAIPGINLSEEFKSREPEAVAPAIEVLNIISDAPPFHLTDVISLDKWFDGMRCHVGTDFPAEYAGKALKLYGELSSKLPPKYLHGDFHPANIVTAAREPYLAIDPKGIIGGLGYDIAVFLNNFHWWQDTRPDVRDRLDAAVKQFSAAFNISEIDLRGWAFATSVLGAWWTFDEMPALYSGGVAKADIWDV
jgi:streptomycin 6-kinase